jgi:hypothetical protein
MMGIEVSTDDKEMKKRENKLKISSGLLSPFGA